MSSRRPGNWLMHPTALVRTVQTERRNGHVEVLAGRRYHHVVGAHHKSRGRVERRAGGVFEALARLEQWLLADHAGTVHMLGVAARVRDLPGAAEQLHRHAPPVLDLHAIGPDIVAL